eukprot:CAMPEP_0206499078 /NCGR_PEP_ID=MMETSP0324_2-20121206/51475_1 /ASSEMBLY_ACC=CAM_ASM_000836 /TAXON_ID=2866 /ORGANISM="Crypthecodinium cohnii, Strain Seligo" /LENGTH=240 /DNA_ID=CAMNT_0053985587 /DNA_START=21 /DNA_END=739 /DNA_ORIENTATION=-
MSPPSAQSADCNGAGNGCDTALTNTLSCDGSLYGIRKDEGADTFSFESNPPGSTVTTWPLCSATPPPLPPSTEEPTAGVPGTAGPSTAVPSTGTPGPTVAPITEETCYQACGCYTGGAGCCQWKDGSCSYGPGAAAVTPMWPATALSAACDGTGTGCDTELTNTLTCDSWVYAILQDEGAGTFSFASTPPGSTVTTWPVCSATPSTEESSTAAPSTLAPSTAPPSTLAPSTAPPSTLAPS